MGFVHAPEKIVQIADNVLICTDEKCAEIVVFPRVEYVQCERAANLFNIDEIGNFPVAVAGNVHERGFDGRLFVETTKR